MATLSSTQLGAIAENLVANALMIESRGRLSPFWPHADDDGIDLLVYDKASGRALPAQIKSRTVTLKKRGSQERGNIVHFEVRAATYRPDRFGTVILVLTGSKGYGLAHAWVIPMAEVPKVSLRHSEKYVFRVSKSPTSRDRCAKFRCDTPTQLCDRVLALVSEAP